MLDKLLIDIAQDPTLLVDVAVVVQIGVPVNTLAKLSPGINPEVLIEPANIPGVLPYVMDVGVAVKINCKPVTWKLPTALGPEVNTKFGLLKPVTVTK